MHFFWNYSSQFLFLLSIISTLIAEHVEVVRYGSNADHRCRNPLMDTEDKIVNLAFKASSFFLNLDQFKPHQSRLVDVYDTKEHTSGNAWCPNKTVQNEMNEWIEVEFPTLVISGTIFTAGRGDGNVKEYMPSFVVQYQREDGGKWYEYRTREGKRVIEGNSDPRSIVRHTLDPEIIAKRIRIYPYSEKMHQQICLRFALYGCEFQDGIVEYHAPEGNRGSLASETASYSEHSPQFDFRDNINDRLFAMTPSQASEGLGKLVDNLALLGNVTRDVETDSKSLGHHFVGWENSSYGGRRTSIQIKFKFDSLRNFSQVLLFTFDSPKLRASLFKQAVIDFSEDGVNFPEENKLTFPMAAASIQEVDYRRKSWKDPDIRIADVGGNAKIVRNRAWDGAVIVILPLKSRIGRFVRLDLGLSDNWLLLSELEFVSVPHILPLHVLPEDVVFTGPGENAAGDNQFIEASVSLPAILETVDQYPGVEIDHNNFINSRPQSQPRLPMDAIDQLPAQNFPESSTWSIKQRELDLETNRSSNSRGTTFIIIVVAGLLISSLFVGLAFILCFRFQHIRRRQSLKKIASSTECHQPLGGIASANVAPMDYPTNYSSRVSCQQTPQVSASPAYILNGGGGKMSGLYNQPLTMFAQPQTPLSVFGTSMDNGGLHESSLGPAGTAFHGLPSPGHGFVGRDLSSLSGYNPTAMHLAMQLGSAGQPTLFLGNGQAIQLGGTGMIHPGGDTTTDSGSLYTLPPDFGVAEMSSRNAVPMLLTSAEQKQQHQQQDSGSSRGTSECEPETSPKALNSTSLITTSSKAINEKSRRTSASTGASHSFEEEEDYDEEDVGSCQSGEALALLNSQPPAVPPRWPENNKNINGEQQSKQPSRQRKRSKRRQRPATSNNATNRSGQIPPQQPIRRKTQMIMQESVQHSCADSGLGSSRADVPPNICGGRTLQHFVQQPFPSNGELLGTEYASTSLFNSSTASISHKPNSSPSPLLNRNFGGGMPNNSTTCGTVLSHFSADHQMSTAPGNSAAYQSRLTPSGDNITQGFGPYHLYQPIGTILIPSPHGSNFPLQAPQSFLGEHQIGLLPGGQGVPTHFLSQGLLRSEPTTSYPSETGVITNGGWSRSKLSNASQISPPGSTINAYPPSWSTTTLKMNPSTYPLPPIPSLPQPPNPPIGDGTGSGRLSIYSVCI